jgi:hypothetical protein
MFDGRRRGRRLPSNTHPTTVGFRLGTEEGVAVGGKFPRRISQ